MTDDQNGGFAYSPLAPSRLDRLSDTQRATLARQDQKRARGRDIGEVRLFFHSLEPGQAEIQFSTSPDAAPADILRAAIRELETAIALYSD